MASQPKEKGGVSAIADRAAAPTGPSLQAVSGEAGIANALAKLREPFPPHQISKLPKETKSQAEQRKKDQANGNWPAKCNICEGYHHPKAVHLDYVGHAALTDRLLDVDPHWSWEPMGTTPEGLPAINGGLWIKLTVCGVSRYGFGAADGKTGGDAIKEMIGDALRNAAMRFGAALDLWHKGDLHVDDGVDEGQSKGERGEPSHPKSSFPTGPARNITEMKNMVRPLWREIKGCGDEGELIGLLESAETKALIDQVSRLEDATHRRELWDGDGKDNPGLSGVIAEAKQTLCGPNILQAG